MAKHRRIHAIVFALPDANEMPMTLAQLKNRMKARHPPGTIVAALSAFKAGQYKAVVETVKQRGSIRYRWRYPLDPQF